MDGTLTDRWHRAGFNVRAWGVNDLGLMEDVYDAYADGMTINFPDELEGYIRYLQKKDEYDARYSNTQYV